MARIPYFDRNEARGRLLDAYGKLPDLNIFNMMGHSGDLMEGVSRLGHLILRRTDAEPWIREIVILRTGVLTRSPYEVFQHERIARALRVEQARIDSVLTGDRGVLSAREKLAMALAEEICDSRTLSDSLFEQVMDEFGVRVTQQLVLTCGYYVMVAGFLNAFGVDIDGDPNTPPVLLPGMML